MDRRDLQEYGEKLRNLHGPEYWRSLEELANSKEFQKYLEKEFPDNASQWLDPVTRRSFLKLMGASLALAGITACTRQPAEKIVPYLRQPEEIVPGKPLFFATAMTLGGAAIGVLAENHMGRPTKIEGNPDHPASLGATDVFTQASILGLYDPDRSQAIVHVGNITSWSRFLEAIRLRMAVEKQKPNPGTGLRLLTQSVVSPTLASQIQELLSQYPYAQWHQYEPVNKDTIHEGSKLAFGEYLDTIYRFDAAKVVVAVDSDFLTCGATSLRYSRDFMAARKLTDNKREMNRLYAIESTPTNTGAKADHRFVVKDSEMADVVLELASYLGVSGAESGQKYGSWLKIIAEDLKKNAGASIIIPGDHQPAEIHAAVHALNEALGNHGKTVFQISPVEAHPVNHIESLRTLVNDMKAGKVETLIILGGNPVYDAPADLGFKEALSHVPLRIHFSLYQDETSYLCHWHIPAAHYLECWGDTRAYDGTVSIVQPLIQPLYEGTRSEIEFLSALLSPEQQKGLDIVRGYWQKQHPDNFEKFWRKSLHDGIIAESAYPPVQKQVQYPIASLKPKSSTGLEVLFRPDPTIYDGRFANNGWLQELPKPMTKIVWDNAVHVSPETAKRLGVKNTDVVELSYHGTTVKGAIWILPGQADDCITIHLGYGRSRAGAVGTRLGFNAYAVRPSHSLWALQGALIKKTDQEYPLATTQNHHLLEGRNIVRVADLEEYKAHPDFAQEEAHENHSSLYPEYTYDSYAWGMVIDQNACVGCNACVIACQSENNIPVVGKTEVIRGREMHWLRIDRYWKGDLHNPEVYYQPMMCVHCEKAPCEVVCPVNATVHSSEGLNEMVYNRCVGTRYCSNNCPWKVRRFNFFLYSDLNTPTYKLMRNPDVTIRTRGVMEKCTYCVQRINYARIEAKKEDRTIRDGEVITACQQACPTQAIIFGNIHDPNSKVAQRKKDNRNYAVLGELGTVPRTTYLAVVKNPNPELKKA